MNPSSCLRCGRPVVERMLGGLCAHCVGAAAFAPPDPAGPARIGGYELLHELGRGGMGVVYLARQPGLDRLVAVKMLLAGQFAGTEAGRRLVHEAREAARLRHPGIVSIHEIDEHDGQPFFSMDFIDGEDLAARAQRRRLPPRETATLVEKLAAAVQHAHAAGVLHRDLKPTNVLCDADDEPHIADFGLAAPLDGEGWLTSAGQVLGSPGFMAPEQLEGRATVASDVYGLGAILYFLLVGRAPFAAAKLPDLLAAVARGDPTPARRLDASVPRDLETIAAKALAREPAARYADAAALARDLAAWREGRPIAARPAGGTERAWRWARRNPGLVAGFGLFVVSLAAGAIVGVTQWRRAETAAAAAQAEAYAANLRVASDALASGDLGEALRQLEACPPARREIAWGLLRAQADGEQEAVVGAAQWTITAIAVSPDGEHAATCGQADVVRVWHLPTRRLVATLPGTEFGWTLRFTPDGKQLVTADRSVRAWDWARGTVVREWPGQGAELSPDGRTLAVVAASRFWGDGPAGGVTLHDFATGETVRALDAEAVRVAAWSADGRWLATAGDEARVECWDVATGARRPGEHRAAGPVWSLSFSADGHRLAASGWSPEVRVWDLRDPAAPPAKLVCASNAWAAEFSREGDTLAVVSSDRQLYLWPRGGAGPPRILRGHHNEVWSVAWEKSGRLLSGGRDPRLLRWFPERARHATPVHHHYEDDRIFWLAGGRLASMVAPEGGGDFVQISDVSGRRAPERVEHETTVGYALDRDELFLVDAENRIVVRRGAAPTAAERRPWSLAAGETTLTQPRIASHGGLGWWWLDGGTLAVHRLADGARVGTHPLKPGRLPRAAVLSADGRWFAWSGHSSELFLYDTAARTVRKLAGHRYEISDVRFMRDGGTLLSGGVDGLIFGWDCASGGRVFELGPHPTSVGRLALSPDESLLASGEPGRGVHVWLLALRREVAFLPVADESGDPWLGFSPDGAWFGVHRPTREVQVFPVARRTDSPPP